jgi:transglutaminase-like putative cysteine protease
MDLISDPDDIYDEYRLKRISGKDDSDIGMVFGYITVVEERPLFTQDTWEFQRRLPTLFSRYTLNLPSGWQAASVTINRAAINPVVRGTSYSWELHDMAPIPPEPDGLSVSNLAPRIVVNYVPAGTNVHVYDSWRDVSKWYSDLSASSLTLDDAVAAKAQDLTINAKTELEKIRAIAEYVQGIRYISLDINVARGGGHRPRPANLVMQRGFGDCKDKANLMRTMLKALKIESYLVLIFSGDPTFVREEWASPNQFNHCIIAVRVGPEIDSPTVLNHEKLGRLLIFDATDPDTQVGDLPDDEQGSFALIAAGMDGGLVKMPVLPPAANRLERRAEMILMPDGTIKGKFISNPSVNRPRGNAGDCAGCPRPNTKLI